MQTDSQNKLSKKCTKKSSAKRQNDIIHTKIDVVHQAVCTHSAKKSRVVGSDAVVTSATCTMKNDGRDASAVFSYACCALGVPYSANTSVSDKMLRL